MNVMLTAQMYFPGKVKVMRFGQYYLTNLDFRVLILPTHKRIRQMEIFNSSGS